MRKRHTCGWDPDGPCTVCERLADDDMAAEDEMRMLEAQAEALPLDDA